MNSRIKGISLSTLTLPLTATWVNYLVCLNLNIPSVKQQRYCWWRGTINKPFVSCLRGEPTARQIDSNICIYFTFTTDKDWVEGCSLGYAAVIMVSNTIRHTHLINLPSKSPEVRDSHRSLSTEAGRACLSNSWGKCVPFASKADPGRVEGAEPQSFSQTR